MSQTSGGDKWWRCTNPACSHPPTIPLSVGIAFKVCPFCTTAQPSQEATSQRSKLRQEVAESLQRPPLHLEADLVERASNLELSTPNISEIQTQGSLENASQTSSTSRNVPQVQFSPEGNVTNAKTTVESHSSQQKPSNDPPSAPGEKPTPGNNGPPGETPKPDSGSPGENPIPGPPEENPTPGPPEENPTPGPPEENPTPGSPKENPTPGPPRENPTPGPPRENPTPSPPGETPKQENTPDNNDTSGTPGKVYIPGTTDNPAPQSNHEASGAENKDSHPTGNPKVSCFYVVFCSV